MNRQNKIIKMSDFSDGIMRQVSDEMKRSEKKYLSKKVFLWTFLSVNLFVLAAIGFIAYVMFIGL